MILEELIKEENITFVSCSSMQETVRQLTEKAFELNKIKNKERFYDAVIEREEIISTGIGLNIAIPHAKLDCIDDFFIIVGILEQEVEWNSIDHKPVKAVFLIGGPENNQKKYLKTLAKLMLLIKHPGRRKNLFAATKAADVTELFTKF